MKRIVTAVAMAALIAVPAAAQEAQDQGEVVERAIVDPAVDAAIIRAVPETNEAEAAALSTEDFLEVQEDGQLLAGDFVGKEVFDQAGTSLGTIEDVLFEEDGRLAAVVFDVGDLLGLDDKRVAIPFDRLRHEMVEERVRLIVNVDRAALEEAPHFVPLWEEAALHDLQHERDPDATVEPPGGDGAPN